MRWTRVAAVSVILVAAGGCASSPPPRGDGREGPQARCLVDPREGSTRPLFFLFCIQNP